MPGPLDIVWSRPLPQDTEPTTVTVSRDRDGRWFVSLLCEDTPSPPLPTTRAVGIDLAIAALVTLSTGEKIRVARIHARIADRRRDHLHKLTTRLVRENQTLVIEDLGVRNMLRNHRLARAISDAAWRELRRILEYKAAWYGRTLVVVDRWFPSSKLCSACGAVAAAMPLNVRAWTCEGCGAVHDRDGNAAVNLLAAGLAVSACGADGRPIGDPPGGRSAVKQEPRPARVGARLPRGDDEAKQARSGVSNAALPSAMPADTLRTSS